MMDITVAYQLLHAIAGTVVSWCFLAGCVMGLAFLMTLPKLRIGSIGSMHMHSQVSLGRQMGLFLASICFIYFGSYINAGVQTAYGVDVPTDSPLAWSASDHVAEASTNVQMTVTVLIMLLKLIGMIFAAKGVAMMPDLGDSQARQSGKATFGGFLALSLSGFLLQDPIKLTQWVGQLFPLIGSIGTWMQSAYKGI